MYKRQVYSFKAFQEAIEDYSSKAEYYQADVCRVPQSVNLTFTEDVYKRQPLLRCPEVENLGPGKVDACVNLYWVLPDADFRRICGFAADVYKRQPPRQEPVTQGGRSSLKDALVQ